MRKTAIEAARCFVEERFPNSDFSILAGSASRGEETPSSDLDIIIFDANSESYRKSFVMYDWRIEVFIHNYNSYLTEFEREKQKGRPILGNMISEGKILKDNKEYLQVRDKATQHVSSGPAPLTEDYINASRYFIGDLLDDFIDSKCKEEALITLNNLSLEIPDFILRLNHHWSGRGKGLTRAFRSFDKGAYKDFFNSLNEFYVNDNKQPFVDFVNRVYKPLGGLLFEGFSTKK